MDKLVKFRVVDVPKRVLRPKLDRVVSISDQIKIYKAVSRSLTRQLNDAMTFYVSAELRASDEQRNT